jgi:hypothetical protein
MTVLARASSNLQEKAEVDEKQSLACRDVEHGSTGISIVESRYLATASENFNRLRLSVCNSDL